MHDSFPSSQMIPQIRYESKYPTNDVVKSFPAVRDEHDGVCVKLDLPVTRLVSPPCCQNGRAMFGGSCRMERSV